ncbi:MAG: glycosyltransferase family 4 protein, partial [Ignavibacteria bacterium]|nr:glycosyltransferase family 4 protein [Ignavibacteria bacterium]
ITCFSKSWGGMEMFAVTSAELLKKNGYEVHLGCIANSQIDINSTQLEIKKFKIKKSSYLSFKNILHLLRYIRKEKPDLIHTQFSKDLWLLVPALKVGQLKIPLVLTKQLASFVKKKDILHKWLYSRVNRAIAISEMIKKNLIETTPLGSEKISVIHNAVDLERFNPARVNPYKIKEEFNFKPADFIFCSIARLSPGKGHEEIIEAVRIVSLKHKNIKVMFVGEAEESELDYKARLIDTIEKYNLNKYFIFAGFRKDIPEILSAIDVFLFPSRDEAFGIALIEAMAMGKPNIVCRSSGILDIIIENETSLCFLRDDISTLASNMQLLIENPELRKKLSRASIERANEFSLQSHLDKLESLYNSL